MHRLPATFLLLLCLTASALAPSALNSSAMAAEPAGGLWNVGRILDTPTPFITDSQQANLRSIRYPSEFFHGSATEVFAYLAVPSEGPGPFPAMLLVHGGGGQAFAEWAQLWAKRGYVALAMDLAGNGPDGKRLEKGGPPQDDDSKFGITDTSPLEDAWTYQAVAAVLRGHALLRQLPQVDKNQIGITGISWGGYLTCIVAGIDHQLSVAVPVYGCGYLGDNSYWQDAGRFESMTPVARQRWLKNFDPSQFLSGVQCPILFVNGTNDFAYPLDSYQKSYELVTSPRSLCITVNMPHGHQAGWAPPEIGAFVDHIIRGSKPLLQLAAIESRADRATTKYAGSDAPATAALHYTTDTGNWQERKWTSIPAEIDPASQEISATLPSPRPLACFFTAADSTGLTTSTPHVELDR